jgi:hypothetical protein
MKRKIAFCLFVSLFVWGFFLTPESHSRSLNEDEQLMWVGTGAFKDGFYDIIIQDMSGCLTFITFLEGRWSSREN